MRILLGLLVFAMLALSGLVAYDTLSGPPPTDPAAAAASAESPGCCESENGDHDSGCPFCAEEKAKGGCCADDAGAKKK